MDRDLEEELEFHVAERTEDFMRESLPECEARLAAERKFGNLLRLREICSPLADMCALGLCLGLTVGYGLSRFTRSLLHEVSPADPGGSFIPLMVLGLSCAAGMLPALWRAARVSPAESLRVE